MYVPALWSALVLTAALVPLVIPPRVPKTISKIRTALGVCLLVSIIAAVTPEMAIEGAPFHVYSPSKIAFMSCNQVIEASIEACPGKSQVFGANYCLNPTDMATISHCYRVANSNLIGSFVKMCNEEFNANVSEAMFEQAHAKYLAQAQPNGGSCFPDSPSRTIFPVKLNETDIWTFNHAYDQFLGNYSRSIYYGEYLQLFWVAVLVLAAISNWSKVLFPSIYRQFTGPVSSWWRRSVSLPATFGTRKTEHKPFMRFFDLLVPTRAETLILASFSVLTVFLSIHNIRYNPLDPIFKSKYSALLRYYSVRTGILASSIMPLVILFAGRNNFLQWITRWDYSTFVMFHRWTSRIAVSLVLVHSCGYFFYLGAMNSSKTEGYILWGTAAFFAGLAILVQGLLVLRRKWYELFLLVHIALAAVFIVGAWVHVLDRYCLWYYYACAGIWAFDRVIRIARLVKFGLPMAQVHLLADETLKVVVPTPENWDAIPGGHAFIHFLTPTGFWQSHPFTYTLPCDGSDNIIIFIKVKEGLTSSLYDYLEKHPGKSTSIRVAIEGSYGEETPAYNYDSAVFVAGGNGIPGIYAEAYNLVKEKEHTLEAPGHQKLSLIWVVREYKSLYWFYEELLSLKDTNIETTIYVTQPDSVSCLEEFDKRIPHVNLPHEFEEDFEQNGNVAGLVKSENDTINRKVTTYGATDERNDANVDRRIRYIKQELSHINFKEGRPHIDRIVKQSIKESNGSTCFVTCGHPKMVDNLRASVANNLAYSEGKRVDYFEQLQVWA